MRELLMIRLKRRAIAVAGTLCISAAVSTFMSACARAPEPPKAEEPPPAASTALPAAERKTEEAVSIPPPTADEVRAKVNFIFEGAATLDGSRTPNYFVGDFNGDGSPDLAVIVKPVEAKLLDINSEVANWILGDPTQVLLPDPSKTVQEPPKLKPVHIERSDSQLLAFIHGHGQNGWRDPLSRQTYLLKNAVGSNPSSQSVAELVRAAEGKAKRPAIYANMSKKGNVIMQGLGRSPGFLYYTGSKYAWYAQK
jgi:hypothetical protein